MKKRIHRIIPCSPMDVSGVQHFLEEMARRGRVLKTEPLFHKYAVFEVGEPQAIRYRLTPSDDGREPGETEVRYARELGWEYKLLWGQFHIYASSDPDAPELNTDPQVMAMAMKPAIKRTVNLILCQLLTMFLIFRGIDMFTALLHPSGWTILMMLAMHVLTIFGGVRNLIRLLRMRKMLRSGQSVEPSPAYQKSLPRYWVSFVLVRSFGYAYLLMILLMLGSLIPFEETAPTAEDLSHLPYCSMMEILPQELSEANVQRESRTLDSWNTILSPVNHESYEGFSILLDDSTLVTCSLHVRYHETVNDGYAGLVYDEMIRDVQKDLKEDYYEETLSIEGLDEVYLAGRRSAVLVIRDDDTVLHVICMVHNVDEELNTCLEALRYFAALYEQEVRT